MLRQELAKPDYHDANLIERIQRWVERLFENGAEAARDVPPLGTFAAIVVGLLIVVGIGLLRVAGPDARPVPAPNEHRR